MKKQSEVQPSLYTNDVKDNSIELSKTKKHKVKNDNENENVQVPRSILQGLLEGTKSMIKEKELLQKQLQEQQIKIDELEEFKQTKTNKSRKGTLKDITFRILKQKQRVQAADINSSTIIDPITSEPANDTDIKQLRSKTNEMESLLAATRNITHQSAFRGVVSSIISASANIVTAEQITLFLLDEEKQKMRVFTSKNISDKQNNSAVGMYTEEPVLNLDSKSVAGRVIRLGKYINIEDYTTQSEKYATPLGITIHSIICLPIAMHTGGVRGAIQAINKLDEMKKLSSFTNRDIEQLQHLSDVAAASVWNLKLSQERQTAQTRIESLLKMSRNVAAEMDAHSVIEKIIEVSYELMHVDRMALFVKVPGKDFLYIAHAQDSAKGLYIPITTGIVGRVARTGQMISCDDAYSHPDFNQEVDKKSGYRTKSILCVPVSDAEGNILAVLQAINKLNGSPFTSEDALYLNYVAESAGLSLHKSQLHLAALNAKKLTEISLKIANSISGTINIEEFVDVIMMEGKSLMGCSHFGLLLVDDLKEELWITASISGTDLRLPFGEGISGIVAQTGKPIILDDAYLDDRFDRTVDIRTGIRTTSVICIPIFENRTLANKAKPRVVAVAMAINKLEQDGIVRFSVLDEDLMTHFCTEIQIALGQLSLELAYFKVVLDSSNKKKGDDQGDSDIASSLMTTYRKQINSRRQSSENFDHKNNYRIKHQDIDRWDLDIFELSLLEAHELSIRIVQSYGLLESFDVPRKTFECFITAVSDNYHNNPFHNFHHGCQVMHATYIFLRLECGYFLSPLEIFAMLIASLCHDVDHPGNNNDYEVKSFSKLAITFSDDAVLERHHTRTTFSILSKPENNIFCKLGKQEFQKCREVIIRAIMATDMTKHFELCKRASSSNKKIFAENKNEMIELMVHVADLSGQALPTDLASKWGDKILDEFRMQAKREKEMGYPVAPFMENLDNERTKNSVQSNFIIYVLLPLWKPTIAIFPALECYLENLEVNLMKYKNELQRLDELAKQENESHGKSTEGIRSKSFIIEDKSIKKAKECLSDSENCQAEVEIKEGNVEKKNDV